MRTWYEVKLASRNDRLDGSARQVWEIWKSEEEGGVLVTRKCLGVFEDKTEAEEALDKFENQYRTMPGVSKEAYINKVAKDRGLKRYTLVLDTLRNCGMDCVFSSYLEDVRPSVAYARGIINGVVTMLMANGATYHEALAQVKEWVSGFQESDATGAFTTAALPEAWRQDWEAL